LTKGEVEGGRHISPVRERPGLFFRLLETGLISLFYLSKFMFMLLPASLFYRAFRLLGKLVFLARRGMGERLQEKIRQALPELSPGEVRRIAQEVCAAAIFPILDLFFMAKHRDEIMSNLRVEGWENLERAEAMGKGVLFTTGHIGMYPILHAVLYHMGKPYTPVMYYPADTPLPRYVDTMARQAYDLGADPENPVFWAGQDTLNRIRVHLEKGKRACITFDVDGSGLVTFFGRPAALATGLAHFSLQLGTPIVPFALFRGEDLFHNRLVFYPPILPHPGRDKREEIPRIMQEVVEAGERMIRQAPGQWMSWFGLWHWWEEGEKLSREAKARGEGGKKRQGEDDTPGSPGSG
jgi:KDO2-lipid IV(A) lauroyltransferase